MRPRKLRTKLAKFGTALAFVILGFPVFAFLPGCEGKQHAGHESSAKARKIYQCSMHPTIVSETPDNCPICGMRLSLSDETQVSAATPHPPGHRKILHYRHPMRPDVTSPKPAKDEMGMDYIPVYEGETEGESSSVIAGHAGVFISPERQQMIGVEKEKVEKRPLQLSIRAVGRVAYDPELYNTLAEHEQAVSSYSKVKESPLPGVRERAEALVRSSELRLRLEGVSDPSAIELLKGKQGARDSLLLPADKAWVYADVYEYEAGVVRPGQKARVTTPALPGSEFEGEVKAINPVLNAMTRTVRVRVEVSNPKRLLKPEMFVDVMLEIPLGVKLSIPEDALLDSGATKLVFVDQGGGRIEPREVHLGYEADGYYEVLAGIREGEWVVVSANFLIDSESRLRAAVKSFGGGKSKGEGHSH